MRIALISYDFDPPIGGIGAIATLMADEIKKAHPEVTFVTISASPNADVSIGSARWNKSLGCPLFSLLLALRLRGILRAHSVDRVHVHAGSGGAFLLRRLNVPILVTAHHTYMQEVRYVFAYHPLKRWTKWLMSLFERRTYTIADRIVSVSHDTKKALVRDYAVDESKIRVIENPIADVAADTATRAENTILYIGRIEPRKGTDVLLKAFATARKKNSQMKLRLVGRNMMGRALKTSEAVTLLGHVSADEMQKELATATALVVPSLLEGFGLIAAQGMMAGTCVIVTNVPGLRSIVENNRTGLIVSVCDAEALADQMLKVMGDTALREELGKAGKAEAQARFNVQGRVSDLYDEYMRLKP